MDIFIENIKQKIKTDKELSKGELLFLYNELPLVDLAQLATEIRERFNKNRVYYNKNFHIEPSNICEHRCLFCSYRRDFASCAGAWSMSIEEVEQYCKEKYKAGMTEVHIVGSVDPSRDFNYYLNLISSVRDIVGEGVAIKAYSAVEIWDMCHKGGYSLEEGLSLLIKAGLDTIPGGGAEIFSPKVRKIICPDKISGEQWLKLHEVAHTLGLKTNCTMLFGHIESVEDRIDHLIMLRDLQYKTGGFNAFIPLKYRIANNKLAGMVEREVDIIEVLRLFAISRIALNNIPHIKAYWPMLGKDLTQIALLFGADDIDGTINDSTKIYSMAGAEDERPGMSVEQLTTLALRVGYEAVERDSYYNCL